MAISKVGHDFRVMIPKEVRELLKLENGDELVFLRLKDGRDVFASGRATHALAKEKSRCAQRKEGSQKSV